MAGKGDDFVEAGGLGHGGSNGRKKRNRDAADGGILDSIGGRPATRPGSRRVQCTSGMVSG
ncbi:hypothetical protein GCM10022240_07370 [Microbacterium kribbense]|uniref:Uncharacterized protein n=1 Tax=Microbacterium kribbense TaxID=433645 RepID=A0ABP7G7F9_9MICO